MPPPFERLALSSFTFTFVQRMALKRWRRPLLPRLSRRSGVLSQECQLVWGPAVGSRREGRRRHAHIRGWTEKPDYASVNLAEADALEVIDILVTSGVGVEAGLWSSQDARRFVADVRFEKCLRVLVEMTGDTGGEALEEAHQIISILDRAKCMLPVLLHGEGSCAWPCIREAWRLRVSTRVGFEDVIHLPDGTIAADNAELVHAAIQLRG